MPLKYLQLFFESISCYNFLVFDSNKDAFFTFQILEISSNTIEKGSNEVKKPTDGMRIKKDEKVPINM